MAFASSIPGGANFDVNERDSLLYVAAERVYMRGNIAEAKSSFVHYLQSFPEGAFSVNAHYYLGLIGYNEKNYAEAAAHLDKVMLYPDNKFSGEAMAMYADMAYRGKDYAKALQYINGCRPGYLSGGTGTGADRCHAQCVDAGRQDRNRG